MKNKSKPCGPIKRKPIPCAPRTELEPGVLRFMEWEVREREWQEVNLHEMERRCGLKRQACHKMERQWKTRGSCQLGSISLDSAMRMAHALGWELRDIVMIPLMLTARLMLTPLPQ